MNLAKKSLKELREQWEEGLEIELVLPHVSPLPSEDSYVTLYVILSKCFQTNPTPLTLYYLHRYFKIGNYWEVSVDQRVVSLRKCLSEVGEAFKEFYPKEDADNDEFDVQIEATVRKTIRVKAKDEDEATELAHQEFTVASDGEPEDYEEQTISVEKVIEA